MSFKSLEEISVLSKDSGKPFWQIVLEDDCKERQVPKAESFNTMRTMYRAMVDADTNYQGDLKSSSGFVGGDGEKMSSYMEQGDSICGKFIGRVMSRAIKMGESNACMKRIVAAPTAGSCGVIPAVLITYGEEFQVEEDKIIEAMFVAAGIGDVIAHRATISGAEGGCQAEIGSASAMAAGAVASLKGANSFQIANAASQALKNLLGLACDPVAGLVEIPCVKRNVLGAVNALTSADMVLAGIHSFIPPDEVIDAMGAIGRCMPKEIRETGEGGLAATPTGIRMAQDIIRN